VIGKLVFENLKHHPLRSLLSVLLIGVPATLILCLVGLSNGMIADSQQRARGSGADVMVRASNAKAMLSQSSATLPDKFIEYLEKQPHVVLAMGLVSHAIEIPLFMNGVDLDRLSRMSGGIHFLAGGPFQGPNDVIIDRFYAEQRKKHVGDTLELVGRDWRVSGIVEGGQLAHVLVPITSLQEIEAAPGKFNQILIKLDDPANTQMVIQDLKQPQKMGDEYPIFSMEEVTSQIVQTVNKQGLSVFITVIIGLGVVIGFLVVTLSMYMAVLQRTREIGILKSLGGSKAFILTIILTEALMLGVGGTALGIVMSYGARHLIEALQPASFQMEIAYAWWPRVLGITLLAAAFGSLYPGMTAAAHDPIEALAYE
jgi:putative ABC transport system permease protein